MVQATPFLLVLSLALVAPSVSAKECVLTGDWTDELGSKMTIGPVDEKGQFDGTYCTVTKEPPYFKICSPLEGLQQIPITDNKNTFGIIVNWNFTDCADVTVLMGQYFAFDGEETLKIKWLELSPTDKATWKPILVATHTFTRQPKQEVGGIAGGCKAQRSTCNADRICCRNTCY